MQRKLRIVPAKSVVDARLIAKLRECKFQPKRKAGMTNSEANDALDRAFEEFTNCLKKKAQLPK